MHHDHLKQHKYINLMQNQREKGRVCTSKTVYNNCLLRRRPPQPSAITTALELPMASTRACSTTKMKTEAHPGSSPLHPPHDHEPTSYHNQLGRRREEHQWPNPKPTSMSARTLRGRRSLALMLPQVDRWSAQNRGGYPTRDLTPTPLSLSHSHT